MDRYNDPLFKYKKVCLSYSVSEILWVVSNAQTVSAVMKSTVAYYITKQEITTLVNKAAVDARGQQKSQGVGG